MKRSSRVLVVGQTPPPVHGSNVMTAEYLRVLASLGRDHVLLDKRMSRTADEVGQPSARKLLRLAQLRREAAAVVRDGGLGFAIYFVAASGTALIADAVVMRVISSAMPCYLYFHGRGYVALAARNRAWARIVSDVLGRARGGVVLSRHLIADVARWIPERRLAVIPNFIEPGPPVLPRESRRGPVRLLFLSNLIPSKGAMDFLLAAAKVGEQGTRLQLTVAGAEVDPRHASELRRASERLPPGVTVQFAGAVRGEEKARLFTEADVFVFPTCYPHETFGLVNLEAMSAALPVIATNIGGIPDVVLHGRTGLLVEPGDIPHLAAAIETLAGSEALRRRLGQEGRLHLERNFTPERFATRWGAVLELMAADEADRLGKV